MAIKVLNERNWIFLVAALAAILSLLSGGKSKASEIDFQASTGRCDGIVAEMIKAYFEKGSGQALNLYMERGEEIKETMVRVVIERMDDSKGDVGFNAEEIANSVRYWGGIIEANHGNLFRCLVPVEALPFLSQNPAVRLIRTPHRPYEAGVTSEGVARAGANLFQNAPSFGGDKQVKIAILDSGFKGYVSLLGSELPATVQVKNFRSDGNFEYSSHGTACAEIVYDMMPAAEIYLVAINDDVGYHLAVDWMIGEKVDVVSSSLTWMCDAGAGDGTGAICEDVKKADQNGITWVQAMGNWANNYWEGQFSESSSKPGFHRFGLSTWKWTDDAVMVFKATGAFELYLSWDDWGTWDGTKYNNGGTQGYALYVDRATKADLNTGIFVFDSSLVFDTIQSGREPFNVPVEKSGVLTYKSPTDWWGVRIKKSAATRNVKFRLYILGVDQAVEFNKAIGSVGIPGEYKEAISVSGISVNDVFYSLNSYGPRRYSDDIVRKPELCGYSGISTKSMGVFEGTSAAAAHVAGAVGLLKSKLPYSNSGLKQVLYKRAIPLYWPGSDGWDEYFGYGRLNLLKK